MSVHGPNLFKSSEPSSPQSLALNEVVQKVFPAIDSVKDSIFADYANKAYIMVSSTADSSFTARLGRWMRTATDTLVTFLTKKLEPLETMNSIHKTLLALNNERAAIKSRELLEQLVSENDKESLEELYPKILELRYLVDVQRQVMIDVLDGKSGADEKLDAKFALKSLEGVVNKLGRLARQASPTLQHEMEAALRISENAAALEKSTNLDQDLIFRKLPDVIGHIDQASKADIQDGLSLIQEQTNEIIKLCSDLPNKNIFYPSDNNFASLANLLHERQKTCAKVIKNIDEFMKDTRLINRPTLDPSSSSSSFTPISQAASPVSPLPPGAHEVNQTVDGIFNDYKEKSYTEAASPGGYSISARLSRMMRSIGDRLVAIFTIGEFNPAGALEGIKEKFQKYNKNLEAFKAFGQHIENEGNALLKKSEVLANLIPIAQHSLLVVSWNNFAQAVEEVLRQADSLPSNMRKPIQEAFIEARNQLKVFVDSSNKKVNGYTL